MRLPLLRCVIAVGWLFSSFGAACSDHAEIQAQARGGGAGMQPDGTGGAARGGANSAGSAARGGASSTGGSDAPRGGANAATGGSATHGGSPTAGATGEGGSGGDTSSSGASSSGGNSAGASQGGEGGTGAGGSDSAVSCPTAQAPVAVSHVLADAVSEASGLAASVATPGVFFTENDSGSAPDVYAFTAEGALVATLTLDGALNEDWEDIQVGPGPVEGLSYIYVADIGDNDRVRTTSIVVHRTPEPELAVSDRARQLTLPHDSLYLRYPDGPHNAETLLVDPQSSDFYIVTKGDSDGSRVYFAAAPHSTRDVIELSYVLSLPFGSASLPGNELTTSGSVARDGSAILLRSYDAAFLWPRANGVSIASALGGTPCALPISKDEPQGEGITFALDGNSYFTLGEGDEPTLFRVVLAR